MKAIEKTIRSPCYTWWVRYSYFFLYVCARGFISEEITFLNFLTKNILFLCLPYGKILSTLFNVLELELRLTEPSQGGFKGLRWRLLTKRGEKKKEILTRLTFRERLNSVV